MAEEDIIYGKNMHLFGGIEPSNMSAFEMQIKPNSDHIKLVVDLPRDTVINGKTLCTVDGAVIVKRTDRFPENEFDGDIVQDLKSSAIITDRNSNKANTYYYSAFPYSTQGVYNRNYKNRVSINSNVNKIEVDGHSLNISYLYEKDGGTFMVFGSVKFKKNDPNVKDVYIEIRRGFLDHPSNNKHGTLIRKIDVTNDSSGVVSFTDNALFKKEEDVYYSVLVCNNNSVYSEKIYSKSISLKKYNYLYGYDLTLSNTNPRQRVRYPRDVDNSVFDPVTCEDSNEMLKYGDWTLDSGFMPKPCVLGYDGFVKYYLDRNNYHKRAVDTNKKSTNISSFDIDGNVMMEWGKIYTKRWVENGVYKFRCSDVKIDDAYECWCNYDENDNEIEHFYTSVYEGVNDSNNRLRSIKSENINRNSFITDCKKAENNGPGWSIETVTERMLIQDLLVLISKSTDCNSIFGNGKMEQQGLSNVDMTTKGLFYRQNTKAVKIFGMENYYGGRYKRVLGLIVDDDGFYRIKITKGVKDGSTTRRYNSTGDGYIKTEMIAPGGGSSYITSMEVLDFGRLPINVTGGSNTTYECSKYYNYKNENGINYVKFANYSGYDNVLNYPGSIFSLFLSEVDVENDEYCSMLVCKPILNK